MLTTALAGSLIASAAVAEIAVKGALEVTLGSGETPASGAKVNQGTTIGYETNVTFSGGTKLTNGADLKVNMNLVDGAASDQAIWYVMGNSSFYIGTDQNGANLDDGHTTPTVGNRIEDGNEGLNASYQPDVISIHNQDVIGFTTKTGVGSFSVAYAPKVGASGSQTESQPDLVAKSGSGMAIGYNGNLGVEGLKAIASYTVRDTDSLDAKEISGTKIGLGYSVGSVSFGANQTAIDDSNTGSTYTAGGEYTTTSAGIVFAASDAISIGYQIGKLETKAAGKVDEDLQSITIGYNLGGATVTAQWTEVENKGGSANVNGEAFELRIVQAF